MNSIRIILVLGILFGCAAPARAAQQDILQKDPLRSYGAIDVILYQTSWCPYCTKARALLDEMGVSLVIYDIEQEPERRQEMLEKSGSPGVPVVDIEGVVIRGYSPEVIRMTIERKRRE